MTTYQTTTLISDLAIVHSTFISYSTFSTCYGRIKICNYMHTTLLYSLLNFAFSTSGLWVEAFNLKNIQFMLMLQISNFHLWNVPTCTSCIYSECKLMMRFSNEQIMTYTEEIWGQFRKVHIMLGHAVTCFIDMPQNATTHFKC